MAPDTTLTLGEFTFGALEIPPEIHFGGSQRLSVHELVGGTRVIDAMGQAERPIEWSGLLLGPDSVARGLYLDGLRIAGKPLVLSWSQFRYSVVVREFDATFQRSYQIPYRIACEVVSNLTQPVTSPGATPIDEQISEDATQAAQLAARVADPVLTAKMGALQSAIAAVSSFAHAAKSAIDSVLQPIADVRKQVGVLIASTANTISMVTTFGGVLPNTALAKSAAALTQQVTSVTQQADLQQLDVTLGRMQANLGAINSPQNTMATAGGNLFQIAGNQYGDAMAWTGIAKANGLTDPFVQGAQVLTIPPKPDQASGILDA